MPYLISSTAASDTIPATVTAEPPVIRESVRPAPVGARFPRGAWTPTRIVRVYRRALRPLHPVGARFPRLSPEQRAALTVALVPELAVRPRPVGARFPR
ncbi:hypothetical protein [Demequina mangrovi]|uniref:Uncharacterized protein n=1 Tax=Demequina mangrovi TaxID=1043493 RepID=A0A1H6UBM5_9MICO|nr:hypothetical protein [Demequina mangrovi]SEI89813.1 hypothetical protein SAMN05421637_0344 [Demequina mangrovi]